MCERQGCGFNLAVKQDENKTVSVPSVPFESVDLGHGRAKQKWCPKCILDTFGKRYVHESDVRRQLLIQNPPIKVDGKGSQVAKGPGLELLQDLKKEVDDARKTTD